MVCDTLRGGFEMRAATILCLRLGLAAVFIYAGTVKATSSHEFAIALMPFTFVPPAWTIPLALGLAATELLAGILLLLPVVFPVGAGISCALCLLFISVLSWALAQGIIVSCGCFGPDEAPSVWKMLEAVGRDFMLLAAALAIIFLPRTEKAPDDPPACAETRGC